MSDPSDKQMDKVLRSYAKKRREEAGPPAELHPVNRRALQDEVARTYSSPKSGAVETPASWWTLLRPWLPLAATVSVFVGIVGLVLVQQGGPGAIPDTKTKTAIDQLSAVDETASTRAAQPALKESEKLAKAEESVELDKAMTSALEPPAPVRLAREESVPRPQPESLSAASPEPLLRQRYGLARQAASPAPPVAQPQIPVAVSPSASGLAAAAKPATPSLVLADAAEKKDTSLETLDSGRKNIDEARSLSSSVASRPASAAVTAANTDAYAFFAQTPSNEVHRQTYSQSTANYRRNFNSPPAVNVLNRFELAQSGDQVQVVDEDGSVYLGQVLASAYSKSRTDLGRETATAKSSTATAPSALTLGANRQLSPAEAAVRGFAFRVSGTNKTLNRLVVFDGNLSPDTNALYGNAQTAGTVFKGGGNDALGQQATAAQALQNSLSNSRIEGRAIFGDKRQMDINAQAVTVPSAARPQQQQLGK